MSTNMLKKYCRIILLITLVSVSRITAQEGAEAVDSEEQHRLLELVEKYTELATKTRMNADFVPGMISVLYGDDLEARGVRTVGEAMTLVPGMNISFSSRGVWKTVVRGIPKPFASGHVKILLNGSPLTTASGVDPIPDMPVAQVERIEIIRGPGSAIHGEFACAGVMNIITRKKDTRIFGGLESGDTRSGGMMISRAYPENDFLLSLSLAGTNTRYEKNGNGIPPVMAMPPIFSALPDDSTADQGPEGSAIADVPSADKGPGKTGTSSEKFMDQGPEWAAGPGEQKKDYGSGILNINYKDFSFRGHWLESRQGNFSDGEIAPADDSDPVYRTRLWGGNLGQGINLFPGLHADFSVGWQKQEFETDDEEFYPPEYMSDSDLSYGITYRETLVYGGMELTWKGWDRHTVFTEYSFAKTTLESRWLCNRPAETMISRRVGETHRDSFSDGVTVGFTHPTEERWLNSLTFQDEFEANDRLTLFGGLRYDHYDDVGDYVSPRIAAVYRLNRRRSATHRHILKAQYARAFRPPTFLETGSSDSNRSETVDTYELAYIYRRFGTAARIMLFYSDTEARITDSRFQTEPTDFLSRGAELELELPLLDNRLKIDGNLSYTDTEDQYSGQKVSDASDWLANVGLIYRPWDKLSFGIQYRYTGPSPDADGYHTADITVTAFDLGIKGLTLSAGVKNVFEANLSRSAGADSNAYSVLNTGDSSVRSDRWWWLKISYIF